MFKMKFIEWYNSLGANMQFVFIFCSIGELICLGMVVYSLVCIIKVKCRERKEKRERAKERYLEWLRRSNPIFGPYKYTKKLSSFFECNLPITDDLSEEKRKEVKSGLAALEEYARIQREFHKCGMSYHEQRPADWKPEEPVLHFDNPFSDLPGIPIRHCSETAPLFVYVSADKMQNGKEIKFTPEISNCICGGKGELVKYTKCEGKDAYPVSYIECNSCGIQTKEFCAEEDNFVIEAWNKTMSGAHVKKGDSENDSDCV